MDLSSALDLFIESESNLLVELRMGNGFDEREYEHLVRSLAFLAKEWIHMDSIPKKAVHPIMEIYDELYNFSLNYSNDQAVRIMKAAEDVKVLITEFLEAPVELKREKANVISRIEQVINTNENFFEKLHSGRGIDNQQFEKIYYELSESWRELCSWEMWPKQLVSILINLYEMDLFVNYYEEELQQQEEADNIYNAHEKIFELIAG